MFELHKNYYLAYRRPTDERTPHSEFGISLEDREDGSGGHHGWVKEVDRQPIDQLLQQQQRVVVFITRIGRRWREWDELLGVWRDFRVGEAMWQAT